MTISLECSLGDKLTQKEVPSDFTALPCQFIARRYGEQSEKESDKNKDLGEELADVMFVVLCLANQTGTDLESAFAKKLQIKTDRDHDRHHNNEKLK